MPLCISEGYHSRYHFEERPMISGRYVGMEQVASGEIEIQDVTAVLWDSSPPCPQLCQSTYLSKLGSVH